MDGRRVCSVQQLRNESGGDSTGSWWYREEEGRPAGIYSLYRYIFTDRFRPGGGSGRGPGLILLAQVGRPLRPPRRGPSYLRKTNEISG